MLPRLVYRSHALSHLTGHHSHHVRAAGSRYRRVHAVTAWMDGGLQTTLDAARKSWVRVSIASTLHAAGTCRVADGWPRPEWPVASIADGRVAAESIHLSDLLGRRRRFSSQILPLCTSYSGVFAPFDMRSSTVHRRRCAWCTAPVAQASARRSNDREGSQVKNTEFRPLTPDY